MDVLTREQAIQRIRDIRNLVSVGHLSFASENKITATLLRAQGSQLELMAIFDIEEEEL